MRKSAPKRKSMRKSASKSKSMRKSITNDDFKKLCKKYNLKV